jgi:ABC-type transporter MlaC component
MRLVWRVPVILLLVGGAVNAAQKEPNDVNDPNYPADPNELVRLRWDAVISVLQNKELDQNAKDRQVDKIVSPIFDFPLMAKLVLGREHWPKFAGPQREKFTQLFIKRLKTSYQEKIALYTDEKAFFKPAVQQKNKRTIHIPIRAIQASQGQEAMEDI